MQDAGEIRSRRDVFAGAIFIAVAIAFGYAAAHYELGSALRMGPGFMPLFLAVMLALFGALVLFAGLKRDERIVPMPVAWKPMILVCVALVVFGEFGATLGLVPVVFVCTVIVAMASAKNTILSSPAVGALLAALCWLVFKVGLGISLPTFGPLFSF